MWKTAALLAAAVCFAVGSFSKFAPGEINWTNAGLCFWAISLLV